MTEKKGKIELRAEEAVKILKEKGLADYTLFVVNWASVYKFHWMMFAFQKELLNELKKNKLT